jgi:hypothetical protein
MKLAKSTRPCLKNKLKAKWVVGMAQVIGTWLTSSGSGVQTPVLQKIKVS